MSNSRNIYPVSDKILGRFDKEARLGQRARVIWFYGLSGSGKSTLANALERRLFGEGFVTVLLDGDNVRTGLNKNLGFSEEDREENVRRVAEVARLFVESGVIVLASLIAPLKRYRETAEKILGEDLIDVYVRCSFGKCADRDVKGLYAKANSGKLSQFTGHDAAFEEPDSPDLVVDTEKKKVEKNIDEIYPLILSRVRRGT